jgi:hypothetical protein
VHPSSRSAPALTWRCARQGATAPRLLEVASEPRPQYVRLIQSLKRVKLSILVRGPQEIHRGGRTHAVVLLDILEKSRPGQHTGGGAEETTTLAVPAAIDRCAKSRHSTLA